MTRANAIHVLVHDTLRAGEANDLCVVAAKHGILESELLGTVTLHGHLYDFNAYPGLVLDPTGIAVHGDVRRIDAALVPVLDEIEEVCPDGDVLFLRENHPVTLGSESVGYVAYPVSSQHAAGRPVITGGDRAVHRLSRDRSRF